VSDDGRWTIDEGTRNPQPANRATMTPTTHTGQPNRLIGRPSYLRARHQSGGLVSWGRRPARVVRGQTDLAQRGLLGPPLRHVMVTNRSKIRHRRADERAVREHQGRPKRPPTSTRSTEAVQADEHGGRPMIVFPDTRAAVLRRHLFSNAAPRIPAHNCSRRRRGGTAARAESAGERTVDCSSQ
jgi:hypothetical protein